VVVDQALVVAQAKEEARLLTIRNTIVAARTTITKQQKILDSVQRAFRAAELKAYVAFYKELAGQRGNHKKYIQLKTAAQEKFIQATTAAAKTREATILKANALIAKQLLIIKEIG
jgi:hypothetical protein